MPRGHWELALTLPQQWQRASQTGTCELDPGHDKQERGEGERV